MHGTLTVLLATQHEEHVNASFSYKNSCKDTTVTIGVYRSNFRKQPRAEWVVIKI